MNNLSSRLGIYLVGAASLFVILFGIRGLASVINPILLATQAALRAETPARMLAPKKMPPSIAGDT